MKDNLKYPEMAKDANTQGTILVGVIVKEDGSLTNVQIKKHLVGPGAKDCAREALRLVNSLPKLLPAKKDGKPVRVAFTFPILFIGEPLLIDPYTEPIKEEDLPPPPAMYDANTVVPDLPEPIDTVDRVFTIVEKMPEFPGGTDAMLKYLSRSIKYPDGHESMEGTAYVQFVVRRDGSITDVTLLRGINRAGEKPYNDEALRVIKGMPKWHPGMQNGKNVSVKYIVPIKFTIH
jgi:TonB family protein